MSRIIDPRARLVCNLGVVDSGGTARDKVADKWLLTYNGNLEIIGNIAPPVGTRVELAYLWRGGLTRFPVRHYVLSASTSAYGRMTSVKIGCRLSLLKERKSIEPFKAAEYPPAWYLALPEGDRLYSTPPVTAQGLVEWCAEGLDVTIAPGSVQIVGNMLRPEISGGDGYCEVLAKILQSHCCIGYLDASEQLVIRKVSLRPGTGPILDRYYLIELSPIGGGGQGAQRIGVRYSATRIADTVGIANPPGITPGANVLAVSIGKPRLLPPPPPPPRGLDPDTWLGGTPRPQPPGMLL